MVTGVFSLCGMPQSVSCDGSASARQVASVSQDAPQDNALIHVLALSNSLRGSVGRFDVQEASRPFRHARLASHNGSAQKHRISYTRRGVGQERSAPVREPVILFLFRVCIVLRVRRPAQSNPHLGIARKRIGLLASHVLHRCIACMHVRCCSGAAHTKTSSFTGGAHKKPRMSCIGEAPSIPHQYPCAHQYPCVSIHVHPSHLSPSATLRGASCTPSRSTYVQQKRMQPRRHVRKRAGMSGVPTPRCAASNGRSVRRGGAAQYRPATEFLD